ncbi:enoyl-CoA hydratase/isomerase family protein [Neobacillus sp. LXY-4]|uniref:enoyl-CoA hydratase/isomerase family protein n=1 Tax=Neobacillus sp. LXY-4 TaxID=3379826 RepID=UPI003EE0FFFD
MSSPVLFRVEDHIGHIVLNRPNKLNALSEALVERVVEALRVAEDDPDVKVIILSGEGSSFCAGTDLDAMIELETASETSKWIEMTASLAKTIVDLDKYVVAAVQGFAAGAGFSIALAADFIIAERSAKFALSFANLGLIPDLGLTKHLVDHLPLPIAKEWISSGKVITAEEAFARGMINRLTDHNVLQEAVDFSKFIINGAPLCNKYLKHLLNRAGSINLDVALMNENMVQTVLLQTEDHKEGIRALIEKRAPHFTGN